MADKYAEARKLMERLQAAKDLRRRELAQLPFERKLEIVEKLRERADELRAAGERSGNLRDGATHG